MEKLVASLELDKKIAEEVMGIVACDGWAIFDIDEHGVISWGTTPEGCKHDSMKCYMPESPPRYSIDMGRAGQLLGKLLEWAAEHDTVITFGYAPATGYRCSVYERLMDGCPEQFSRSNYYETPELAICEAALEYLQGETDD